MNSDSQDASPGFLKAFEELEDPRTRNCPHPLNELLLVALGGVTSGARWAPRRLVWNATVTSPGLAAQFAHGLRPGQGWPQATRRAWP